MTNSPALDQRLAVLYPDTAGEVAARLESLISEYRGEAVESAEPWTERDVVLITYAGQIRGDEKSPLATMTEWLTARGLNELLTVVHLLPFCPWSSDDGFSVIDYLEVDPVAGSWQDIADLGEHSDLMFDLVLNHISQHSDWFRRYKRGEEPYRRFFIEVGGDFDTSQVVRPRSLPLLTPADTVDGTRQVWTTFSEDQIDLNYAEPEVLIAMLRILLEYAKRGARIIRLDAIAYLWKTSGTTCIHLPQTHEAVKIMRDVVSAAFPQTLLLTETNVPHDENVAYFGDGDEAHMVYQFSLPPLLVDAFVHGDATWLRKWLSELDPPPPGCTYFNFTASHDGIGVRPLEGLVPAERLANVVEAMRERGGLIGTRRMPDGSDSPYELNICYVDAISPTTRDEPPHDDRHARRFLATQAVMLAMQGMPAVYIHSLVGSRNDYAGVESSGINRRINRHKFHVDELQTQVADGESLSGRIFEGYQKLLSTRQSLSAFHPNASQSVVTDTSDELLAFVREGLDGEQKVLVVVNFANEPVTIHPEDWLTPKPTALRDLLDNAKSLGHGWIVPDGACAWFTPTDS